MNGWMDDLQFNLLFNNISFISGRRGRDNERLYNGTLFTFGMIMISSWSARSALGPALNLLSYIRLEILRNNRTYLPNLDNTSRQ